MASSSRQVPIPPPPPLIDDEPLDPYARLSFQPASQAQILRAHQRDSSQIQRLIELTSEIIRSIAGTRWLANKQTIVDLLVKAVYLSLTFGRGSQTLGEEYTDVLPSVNRGRSTPSRARRLLTILFLLLPSIITSPSAATYLRSGTDGTERSAWSRAKIRAAEFLESPWGQSIPELHMIAFLFGGRFLEIGRRLTGLSYISTLPPKPGGQGAPSYEPLALLLALPIMYRLFPRRVSSGSDRPTTIQPPLNGHGLIPPLSPPLTPPPDPHQTFALSKPGNYDEPNTYLTHDALALPERQCTLCLEPRGTGEGSGGTVAVTECGHVFCWGCLGGLEKPECPLCRQSLRMERLIAAYNL